MPVVLTLLRIKNLALVEELEWQMGPGFVAVTGETGAGKSIIIGALQLLLGERAGNSLIRTGTSRASAARCNAGNRVTTRNHWMVATTLT
jgi:DNA repair protein RecN (Recombination protein N)